MTQKEILVEAIDYFEYTHGIDNWYSEEKDELLAGCLIQEGILAPPVKINQKLYDIYYNRPREWKVVYIGYNGNEFHISLHNATDNRTIEVNSRFLDRGYFTSLEEAKAAISY